MAANPTIYCLEEVSDYTEFERLCTDLMSLVGYKTIEPLGSFKDKGRDAIHVSKTDGTATVFAYSVRENWRAKLAEDAKKVHDHGHVCNTLVFVTTEKFTVGERDEAVNSIKAEFGWTLELYGLERLRVLLDVDHSDVKKLHPQIFPPQFLNIPEQEKIIQDHLFVSFAPEDKALAVWLTQKLTAEGYKVWCEPFALLGGENYPKNVDDAIKKHTFRFVALYSRTSLTNTEVVRQRAVAATQSEPEDFILPLNVDGLKQSDLDRQASGLQFIDFENWADGLEQLLKKLEKINCPKDLPNPKTIASESFLRRNFLSEKPETLISNFLQFKKMPANVLHFYTEEMEGKRIGSLRSQWAFKFIEPGTFLSLQTPSQDILDEFKLEKIDEYRWKGEKTIHGIPTQNLLSELIRRSLEAKCNEKGLRYYREGRRSWNYFPQGLVDKDHIKYSRLDGKTSYVNVAGKRLYWTPNKSDYYLYHLAPDFYIRYDVFDDISVAVRLRLFITDEKGNLLPPRPSLSRRKRLCRDWWNDEWLNRVIAVCQFLGDDGQIVIGSVEEEQMILDANPIPISAPISVDEDVMGGETVEERDELLGNLDEADEEESE